MFVAQGKNITLSCQKWVLAFARTTYWELVAGIKVPEFPKLLSKTLNFCLAALHQNY
jgi:hypothetical protein